MESDDLWNETFPGGLFALAEISLVKIPELENAIEQRDFLLQISVRN